jgi:NAD-dependent SIR2 family protein deacetylase
MTAALPQQASSDASKIEWHGALGAAHDFPLPVCAVASDLLSRPGYSAVNSSEYVDSAEVLDAKADLLVEILRRSKQTLIYSGAGISTSAGIGDYASRACGSLVQQRSGFGGNRLEAQPTPAHRILAALEKKDLVQFWLQQNHDGLAQKAGFPFEKLNEIHGSWFDKKNPVCMMDDALRSDLYEQMLQWEERAELVLAIGTSLSGMNADRVATSCARRFQQGKGLGTVIISIQKTPLDGASTLRVFAKIDQFLLIVQKKMKLVLDTSTYSAYRPATLRKPSARKPSVGRK